ncbi:thioredoxin reductase 3 [Cebus imitator]|uniref:thioredoxin reductase 3 n=1 Tax=Cebus imitator TaxID=2715852 RepID=UPI001897E724|nr:thioredoxin reductase 3 [Cebus imitator]
MRWRGWEILANGGSTVLELYRMEHAASEGSRTDGCLAGQTAQGQLGFSAPQQLPLGLCHKKVAPYHSSPEWHWLEWESQWIQMAKDSRIPEIVEISCISNNYYSASFASRQYLCRGGIKYVLKPQCHLAAAFRSACCDLARSPAGRYLRPAQRAACLAGEEERVPAGPTLLKVETGSAGCFGVHRIRSRILYLPGSVPWDGGAERGTSKRHCTEAISERHHQDCVMSGRAHNLEIKRLALGGEQRPRGFVRVWIVGSKSSVRHTSAPVPAPPPSAFRFVSGPGPAGSESETLEQSPKSPGPGKAGDAPNRRPGHVRGARVASPPERRARLASPGPSSSSEAREELRRRLLGLIERGGVVIFSKSYCPHSTRVKELFSSLGAECYVLELDQVDDGAKIQEVLLEITNQKTVPNIFVNKVHVGGCDQTFQAYQSGLLQKLLHEDSAYDYDLIVIGGGSGGLSCAKEAAILGKKVMVLDFVVPSPQGTSWGLGGTCVNVGCVPKKLMHQAALLGQALHDSRKFGWEYNQQVTHNWETMTKAIQNHIRSLNFGYGLSLREKAVAYVNSYGEFVEHHKIKATNKKGQETYYTAAQFVIATGERPRYLGIQGDKEYCITSDDLFSLPYCPGKTLVVGASYVALECAGFLAGFGLDVTVMVRSILLRGFDQEMAEKVGSYMEQHGVRFLWKFIPVMVQQLEKGSPGKLKVLAKSTEGTETIEEVYNTVLLAIGRDSCTRKIGLEKIGVKINEKSGKIPVNDVEQTSVPYVYAVGDILEGKPELTPVAIQSGKLLARRLFGASLEKCDYINVPTTVFTPLEYGCCGLSEEKAIEVYKKENLEIYHTLFWPLEWTVAGRENNTCYAKIICNKFDHDRVIGFHILGPNAGEVTQGFAAAMKCGLTKQLLDDTIGIHPTCGEVFTTLEITKSSGLDITQKGC